LNGQESGCEIVGGEIGRLGVLVRLWAVFTIKIRVYNKLNLDTV